VQQGAGLVPVPVTVGNFNDQFIEIRGGLKEGDQVALTPPASTTSEEIDTGAPVLSTEDVRPTPAATTAKRTSTDASRL
jgi:multidrug efflux pump subunit AcrA (membrane-fusion protein)